VILSLSGFRILIFRVYQKGQPLSCTIQDVLLARITTQEYTTETDYKILDWPKSGLLAESYIRLGKQATIEKRFIIRKLGTLEAKDTEVLKSILKRMFHL